MRRLLLLFIFLFSLLNVFSQEFEGKTKRDDVFYFKTIEEKTNKVDNLLLGVDFSGLDLGQMFAIGYGLDAQYFLKNKLLIKVNVFKPYFRVFDSEVATSTLEGYYSEIKKYSKQYLRTDFNISYYFYSINRKKYRQIEVDCKQEGVYDNHIFIKPQFPVEHKFGIRTGYYYYQQSANEILIYDNYIVGDEVFSVKSITNQSIYFGFSALTIHNFIFENEELGVLSKAKYETFYFDLLYGIGGKANMLHDGSKYDGELSMDMRKIGFRVGINYVRKTLRQKRMWMSFGFESGMRPILLIPFENNEETYKNDPGSFFLSFRIGLRWSYKM